MTAKISSSPALIIGGMANCHLLGSDTEMSTSNAPNAKLLTINEICKKIEQSRISYKKIKWNVQIFEIKNPDNLKALNFNEKDLPPLLKRSWKPTVALLTCNKVALRELQKDILFQENRVDALSLYNNQNSLQANSFNLIDASDKIYQIHKERFDSIWQTLCASLKADGYFHGDFFLCRDPSLEKGAFFESENAVHKLFLEKFSIMESVFCAHAPQLLAADGSSSDYATLHIVAKKL